MNQNDKLTRNGLYQVHDKPSYVEFKNLGCKDPCAPYYIQLGRKDVKAQWTGEKRCPKAGEWYLSGAIIEAYKAFNDLSTPYYIAKLVRTEMITTERIVSK